MQSAWLWIGVNRECGAFIGIMRLEGDKKCRSIKLATGINYIEKEKREKKKAIVVAAMPKCQTGCGISAKG